jgi:hypothetical protein
MKITRKPESSHWYHRDGTPCHEVIGKSTGLPRPTTVADARKLNLVPSVTSIIAAKSKPALNTWLQDNAIRAALTTPQNPGEPEDQWHSRIAVEADRIGREAAEWGTLLHAELETYLTTGALTCTGEILDYLKGAEEWLRNNVETTIQAEQSVVGDLGYAGRLDLYAVLKDGRRAVIDFKSQRLVGKRAPGFYKEWAMQLAAYGDCLREEGETLPALISVIIPSDAPGPVFTKEWDNGVVALDAFHACFRLWCFEKDYTP